MPDRVPSRYGSAPPPRRQTKVGAVSSGARAPYNFVPLPEQIRPADEPPAGDRYHDDAGRYTGSILLSITTKTPLYLRGTMDAEQPTGDTPTPGFFAPSGRPAIPGSSLRGMLRTLVEIVSASAFVTDYDRDRRFAYRTVADPASPLGQTYRQRIGQVYAGHLEQGSDGLRMLPAKQVLGQRFWQVKQDVLRRQLGLDVEQNQFSRLRVYFEPTDRRCGKNSQLCCIDQVQAATGAIPANWLSGWLILSGFIEKKSHGWIIADPDESKAPLPVPELVKADYLRFQADALREAMRRVSADERFPLLPQGAERIPCFYTLTTQRGTPEVGSFGHTRWFRLNYQRSVGDAVPAALRPDRTGDSAVDRPQGQQWDLARALFGRVGSSGEAWAGRVFVEDAVLAPDQPEPFLPLARRQILATPKPTTVQHYLEPRDDGRLQHWDSANAKVRGHKLYWHRPNAPWQEPSAANTGQGASVPAPAADADERDGERRLEPELIQPVAPERKFEGRLRFENLTEAEVGALLFALDVPEGCRHRLGQGKPLGLGSVQITTQLHLDDRVARYQRLFADAADGGLTWAAPERQAGIDKDECRRAFARWLLQGEVGQAAVAADLDPLEQVWELPRMQALRALLDWDHAPNLDATAYMSLEPKNEYSGRPVLPRALAVVGDQQPGTSPGQPAPGGRPAGPQHRPSPPSPLRTPSAPPVGKPGGATPGNPPPPPRDIARPVGREDRAVSDGALGSRAPTGDDPRRRFQRSEPSPGATPKRESAGDKAKREQRELMDRLRRDSQRER